MRVGFVTIGQSPRVDIMSEVKPMLGPNVEVLECGALDGLSSGEISELAPRAGDYVLVTRLRDGTPVRLSRDRIVGRMQGCIDKLEGEVDLIGLLCTGDFPELRSRRLIIEPSRLIMGIVSSISGLRRLGIIVHDADQVELERVRWGKVTSDLVIVPLSAYTSSEDDFRRVAEDLRGVDLIVLDSLGYNMRMRNIVREVTGKPVLLPRMVMASVIRGLIGNA